MKREAKREYMSDRIARWMLMMLFTILLVLGLAFLASATVLSQSKEKLVMDEARLRILEQEYVSEVRAYLEAQGYQNSGVTLTWMMEEDGSRCYEIVLYHKNMKKLSLVEQEMLYEAVKELAFEVNGCYFQVNLLV